MSFIGEGWVVKRELGLVYFFSGEMEFELLVLRDKNWEWNWDLGKSRLGNYCIF